MRKEPLAPPILSYEQINEQARKVSGGAQNR